MKKQYALLAIVLGVLVLVFGCKGDALPDKQSEPDGSALDKQSEPDGSALAQQSETAESDNPVLGKWVGRSEITEIDWDKAGDVDKEVFLMHHETIEEMEIMLELKSDGTYWMTAPGPIVRDKWERDNGDVFLPSSMASYILPMSGKRAELAYPIGRPMTLQVSPDGTTLTAERFGWHGSYTVVFFTIVFTRDTAN